MRWIPKSRIIIHRKITWLLLFSIFSMAMASWLLYVAKNNIDRTSLRINETYETIGSIHQLLTATAHSDPNIHLYLDSLQENARDNNDLGPQMVLLQAYIAKGTANTDTVRALLHSMIHTEKQLLAERKLANDQAGRRTTAGLLIGRFIAFLLVVVLLIQLNNDISRRKRAEMGLLENQEMLMQAIGEAQQAKQLQEQFLANMSHEIRTPMNGIKGMTDLLLGTPLSSKQHELAGIIKSSVNNLLVIVNDILDFSKIKAGKLNIEKIDFSIKDVLNSSVAIFEHRLKKKGLLLRVDVGPDIPAVLVGDPHRLNQVLINLLGNAIKFTDQGHIHIQVSVQERSEERIVLSFSITDTGIGMSPENLPYIFDSFSQAGLDISRRYGGTGLGLTICKQLLNLQGGDITATSKSRKGSVFQFHLPYGYSTNTNPQRTNAVIAHDYSNLLTGRRFLVAEDNEINQKLIDYVLRKAGGTVELVNNGAEAIRYLQHDKIFDLIIMDLQMPEMDGYAATRYIRNDLHMETPIIAMTATALKGEQLQCIESGMNEYMTKPFEFADLYKRISSLLS